MCVALRCPFGKSQAHILTNIMHRLRVKNSVMDKPYNKMIKTIQQAKANHTKSVHGA